MKVGKKSEAVNWRDVFNNVESAYDDTETAPEFDDTEWNRIAAIADDLALPFSQRELWIRLRIWAIGEALIHGRRLPDEAARWIGQVLQNIAQGDDPKDQFRLKTPSHAPKSVTRRQAWAAEMVWLTHQGETQTDAACIIAERESLKETRQIIQAHNDLRKRRGVFQSVTEVIIEESAERYVAILSEHGVFLHRFDR